MTNGVPEHPDGQLAQALRATEALVARVGDDQWTSPTVCPGWTVRDLLDHLVRGNEALASVVQGRVAPDGDVLGHDPLAAYHRSGDAVRAALAQPGVFGRTLNVPAGTVPAAVALHLRLTELLVHGWDLATATGQSTSGLPEDLAEQELAFSRRQLALLPPGRMPFAPPQPVGDDAPAIDRLAALLGRSTGTSARDGW